MKDPLVSIIIPTLNAGKFLRPCLESIFKQTFTDFEVVVVDGGSTDETLELAASFSDINIIRQTGKGQPSAWNEGIQKARGSFISFIDSDDIWNPNALELHVSGLQQNPNYMASIGHLEFFLDDENIIPPGFKISLLEQKQIGYMPGCFMGRKDIFKVLGEFETRWTILSDLVWFDKLKMLPEKTQVLDEILLRKRVHDSNLSYLTAETPVYKKELLQYIKEKITKSVPQN